MGNQPCFKREVTAVIVGRDGRIAVGQNLIYNDDLEECPRAKGEGYDKCISICNQKGHAEIMAIKKAKERYLDMEDANIYLIGHHRICDNCKEACDNEGLNVIIVNEKGV